MVKSEGRNLGTLIDYRGVVDNQQRVGPGDVPIAVEVDD
jgi:hypothetical protein